MAASIIDLIAVILIIAYIFWKHRDNLDWYALVLIIAISRGAFDLCIIARHMSLADLTVDNLNMFSRVIHWLSISTILYYSIKGEKKWKM